MQLARYELRMFGLAIGLSMLACGIALVSPSFSVDDLWYFPVPYSFDSIGLVGFGEGRFTIAAIAWLDHALGVDAPVAFTLAAFSMMVFMSVAALLVCRLWGITENWKACVVAVAILVTHPYLSDFYTWKLAQLNGGIPFVVLMGALLIAPRSRWCFVLSVGLIVLALGIHQIPLQYGAVALLMSVPIRVMLRDFCLGAWVRQSMALLLGTVVYVLAAQWIIAHTHNLGGVGRHTLIVLSHPALLIPRTTELLSMMVVADPLIGWLVRLLGLIVMALAVDAVFQRTDLTIERRWTVCGLLVLIMPAAFLCAIALTIVPTAWVPVFRNLSSMSVIWAAVAVLATVASEGVRERIVLACVGAIVFAFIGSSNQVLSDQQRANRRDVSLINRITADVERLDQYATVNRLVFIGTSGTSLARLRTRSDVSTRWHEYGTTLSAFSVWWPGYLVQLYNEINGTAYSYVVSADERRIANNYCASRRWPTMGSVTAIGEIGVVCLSPAVEKQRGPLEPLPD